MLLSNTTKTTYHKYLTGGYSKKSILLDKINLAFNKALALFFIILGLPIFIILAILIKIINKGPIFYKGIRLGKNKKPFVMYKFRTLPVDAQKKIGAKLFSTEDMKKFQIGNFAKFLRDTRLDELPQLFNILKGDMDFIGPRPERPEIYENICKQIPGYDLRFKVRPGLIGYSQLLTPHSTPKRIRTLIDNAAIRFKQSIITDFLLIILTIYAVTTKTLKSLFVICKNYLLHKHTERRMFNRIKPKNAFVYFYDKDFQFIAKVDIIDIDDYYFKFKIPNNKFMNIKEIKYAKFFYPCKKRKRKLAKATVHFFRQYQDDKNNYYVFSYIPYSEYYKYIFDQYFLRKSLLNCF